MLPPIAHGIGQFFPDMGRWRRKIPQLTIFVILVKSHENDVPSFATC